MSLHTRIKQARTQKGWTQSQLGARIGVAKTTVAGYEKERDPDAQTLGRLADALDVSADFLFQDEITRRAETSVSAEELQLLRQYRALDAHGRRIARLIIGEEAARVQQTAVLQPALHAVERPARVIELRLYAAPVSAGTGELPLTDDAETLCVAENSVTQHARYAVRVRGNSMEPRFHDGDLLLVGSGEVHPGEIGVFFMDGQTYVKQLGKGELRSLNPEYAPIPLTDDAAQQGNVIGTLDPAWLV